MTLQSGTAVIEFDPFQAGGDADPYPLFDRLREEAPLYHSREHGFYAVSRFDDVQRISRDWERFSNAQGIDIDRTGDYFGPNFLDSDPPRHRLLRSLVQSRFSPKTLRQSLDPVVREIVDGLVTRVIEEREADLGTHLAWPLPFAIACHLLGFPPEDRDFLWDASRRFIEREPGQRLPPGVAQDAASELQVYLAGIVEVRRRVPGDDLISLLVSAAPGDVSLPESELIGNAFLLFDAGTQTTACLLTNALVLLAQHPEQRAWLIRHPEAIPDAVEEILRIESPVQHLTRTTTTAVELHGQELPAGATVALLYGAANRDPRRWPEHPDRLDLARLTRRNLAFGEGIHHCLGAPIARLEAARVLEALLPHLATLELTAPPVRLRSHLLRGWVSVPASLG